MKTAMQELMDWFYNRPEYDKSSEGYEIMTMCEILLNVEKEQIIDAYCNGYQDGSTLELIQPDEYFSKKYNQNK
jgi:hypothetical protein